MHPRTDCSPISSGLLDFYFAILREARARDPCLKHLLIFKGTRYVLVGDIARSGTHPPNVAAVYQITDRLFALSLGYEKLIRSKYNLENEKVWRNCADDYTTLVSIWRPRPPQGYVSAGCVAVSSFTKPEPDLIYCMAESIAEETTFEEHQVWYAPDSYPWTCCIYQVQSPALHFVALRQPRDEAAWKHMKVIDDTSRPSVSLLSEASSSTSGH
ncbi:pleckstrin domain superfamily protein [Tanacetum coccineum]